MQQTLEQAVSLINKASYGQETVIIAIDGRCGAGKTTLALNLAQYLNCNVFHLDDFFLSQRQRAKKEKNEGFANADLKRFEKEVLKKVIKNKPFSYFKYLPESGKTEKVQIKRPMQLNIVEGSFCTDTSLDKYYALKIFLTAELEVRTERLKSRGENIDTYRKMWIPLEENFFRVQDTQQRADVVFDTSSGFEVT